MQTRSPFGAGYAPEKSVPPALNLSPKTVETHRAHITEKLRLPNAPTLVRFAVDWAAHRA